LMTTPETTSLFDHLVGAGEERVRYWMRST
jgi:hypothetical protein